MFKKVLKQFSISFFIVLTLLFVSKVSVFASNSWNFSYTGGVQKFTAPRTGRYNLYIRGGDGGGSNHAADGSWGAGGSSQADIFLRTGETLYIQVGGVGTFGNVTNPGGYNGGGTGTDRNAGGGGATSIALTSGLLKDLSDSDIVLVAGGGAGRSINGTYYTRQGGNGGGETGMSPQGLPNSGGTQTSGYLRGVGENSRGGGAGGGGYWGGRASYTNTVGGGGGSGYIGFSKLINPTTGTDMRGDGSSGIAGMCRISYVGPAMTQLIVSANGGGKINGADYITVNVELDKPYTLPTPTPLLDHASFDGYELEFGDGTLSGNTYVGGFKDAKVLANWYSKFSLTKVNRNNNRLRVKINIDNLNDNTYFVQKSLDKANWTSLLEDGTQVASMNAKSAGPSSTGWDYSILARGKYRILSLAGGGGSSGVKGSTGASITADFSLNFKDTVRFIGGHHGENSLDANDAAARTFKGGAYGGGNAYWSGAGGGTYKATLLRNGTETKLIASGGGGGGISNPWLNTSRTLPHATGHGGRTIGSAPSHNRTDGSEFGGEPEDSHIMVQRGGAPLDFPTAWRLMFPEYPQINYSAQPYIMACIQAQPDRSQPGDAGGGGAGWIGGRGGRYELYTNYSIADWGVGGYGGQNGYNSSYGNLVSQEAGRDSVDPNNGKASITPLVLYPYEYDQTVNTVLDDIAPPNAPFDGTISQDKKNIVTVSWAKPDDNGTMNYFRAARVKNLSNMATDRQTQFLEESYTSGVKGYYYILDSSPSTVIRTNNSSYTTAQTVSIPYNMRANGLYFHVAAIDHAGNLGPTYTIEYNLLDELEVHIYTTKIGISSNTNNYHAKDLSKNNYFVKGSTDENISNFFLSFIGKSDYRLHVNYQMNHNIYDAFLNEANQNLLELLYNSKTAITWNNITDQSKGYISETNNNILRHATLINTVVTRDVNYNNMKNVTEFNVSSEFDNQTIEVVPESRIAYQFEHRNVNGITSSKDIWTIDNRVINGAELDKANKILLTVDSIGPRISIPTEFQEKEDGTVPVITGSTTIPIEYVDYVKNVNPGNPEYGSGVITRRNQIRLIVTQEQTDNGGPPKQTIYNEDTINNIFNVTAYNATSGRIDLALNPQVYANMSGFINVRVEITDNVGNVSTADYRFLVISLRSELVNTVNTGRNYFLGGEQAQIKVETLGFIDQVSFKFPDYLNALAAIERTPEGNWDAEKQAAEIINIYGRIMDETYPRDSAGQITRVFPSLQTALWGTRNYLRITQPGGMEWTGTNYANCFLTHYFYVPIYTKNGRYSVVVTAYKLDPKSPDPTNPIIYAITNRLVFGVGVDPNDLNYPINDPTVTTDNTNITIEIQDHIRDN